VPFQLGYRPRNTCKNQKAPIFGRSLRELESELGAMDRPIPKAERD
jgi:hypothetical protein